MKKIQQVLSSGKVDIYLDASFNLLTKLVDKKNAVIVTDENIFSKHRAKFKNWNVITLKPGEQFKIQLTADAIIEQLIEFQADRSTTLIGVGGGVITDLTGYVASIYMRGIRFGFVPTTLLAMVDASIGGKNGVDVGAYKNLVGSIRQPSFLLYDYSFLKTLPEMEWSNGFAEIIKHACIFDNRLFDLLKNYSLDKIKKDKKLLASIVAKNVSLKLAVVKKDEFETGDRKLLNFGHTLGHALETQYDLTHGQAVALGMVFAAWLSEKIIGLKKSSEIIQVLGQYKLPTFASFDADRVFNVLVMDKKRVSNTMHFILLNRIGKGVVHPIKLNQLQKHVSTYTQLNK
ncbi:MAG: 3-dehydroquinate synthase [Bacteroidota bacterium]